MKKLILTTILAFVTITINAQFKAYAGKIKIGSTTYTPNALLDVCTSSTLGSTRTDESAFSHYYSSEANPRWGIGRDYLANGQAAILFGAGRKFCD